MYKSASFSLWAIANVLSGKEMTRVWWILPEVNKIWIGSSGPELRESLIGFEELLYVIRKKRKIKK